MLEKCIVCHRHTVFRDKYGLCRKCQADVPKPIRFRRLGKWIVPAYPSGAILQRERWISISTQVRKFYYSNSDEVIDAINAEKKSEDELPVRTDYPGYVYLLESANGYHKIGRATRVDSRLAELNRQFPIAIQLVHAIPTADPVTAERRMHIIYDEYRVEGEWFRLPENIVTRIKAMDTEALEAIGEPVEQLGQ